MNFTTALDVLLTATCETGWEVTPIEAFIRSGLDEERADQLMDDLASLEHFLLLAQEHAQALMDAGVDLSALSVNVSDHTGCGWECDSPAHY